MTAVLAVAAAIVAGLAGYPPQRAFAAKPEPAVEETATAVATATSLLSQGISELGVSRRPHARPTAQLSTVKRTISHPRRLIAGPWRTATASWYGPGLYGSGMAGGGRLRRDSMVVAHKTMKFGTKIQFSYKGRTVIAEVRDRGPFIAGRTFDLGPGIARALRFDGVQEVRWRVVR